MEANVIKCPNCGANATNHNNCEYCGSLLVRFIEKGIEINNTSYIDDSLVFPGLLEELVKNLNLQEKGNKAEEVLTEIRWLNKNGDEDFLLISSNETDSDEENIENVLGNEILISPQLVILVSFYTYTWQNEISFNHNNEQDDQFMRFSKLRSYPLFTYIEHEKGIDDDMYTRDFVINFGQDANGAARLISEILIKVKGLSPSDSYGIFTGIDDDYSSDAYKAWQKKHGFKLEDTVVEEANTEEYEQYDDNSKESSSIWEKIISIFN